MIREENLLENGKIAREPAKDVDWVRGGRIGNYTRGEINCYHTSYSATNDEGVPRGATHLKKDGKVVGNGKLAAGLLL